jgi:penicillin amidase
MLRSSSLAALVGLVFVFCAQAAPADLAETYAKQVTIQRDEWGVPHIKGPTDASVVFGVAYATCEDNFWQVEETMLQMLGRYAEAAGEPGLDNDLKIALFEVVKSSKADYEKLDPKFQAFCEAYAAGYNFYLKTHPEVKPRAFTRYEPYQMLCYERSMMLLRLLGHAHAPQNKLAPLAEEMRAHEGSNAWAISGAKTADGNAMLFINPHQPWFGTGSWTEVHVMSDEGWNVSGATFPGGPFPTMGHNEFCGWAYTVNEPDVGDVYRLTFDKPDDKLAYKYGEGYKHAEEWKDTIKVKTDKGLEDRVYTFRKSHYGPIMAKEDEQHYLAVKIAKLFDGSRMRQSYGQTKAKSFAEWYAAASAIDLQMFNTVYADRDGNIFFLYNGAVARKDPTFDWRQPVDGSDPKTEWNGFHPIQELPQSLNPLSGFLESCNSTPFTATDDGAPSMKDFPPYMVEDRYDDMRRAKMSRHLLRNANHITFDDWQKLAYDTTLYWPMTELPRYAGWFEDLKKTNPDLAGRVAPYLEHLLDWDYKSTAASTQTTLCVEWYEQLYGRGYPVEDLKKEFVNDIPARFQALVKAADTLTQLFGSWKVPYGDIHRLQRLPYQASPSTVPFSDDLPSIPQVGVRGPLGVAFTVYDTPSTPERKNRYAVVGASYMAVVEFGDRLKAKSYLHFGQSGNPDSPHFFDQAALLSKQQFKDAWFYADDVDKHTVEKYHPGEKAK